MYKRKFEDGSAVAHKKARMDFPDIMPIRCKHAIQAAPIPLSLVPIVPEPLKKRKRSEECEAETSRDREARRIKSSHGRSGRLEYPRSLSPASKYQILLKTEYSSEQSLVLGLGKYWEGRTATRSSTPDDNPTSALKDTIITADAVPPIRLAKPQEYSPAFIKLPIRKDQRQVQGSDEKQQPRKRQKQRSSKIPAPIQKSVPITRSRPYYSSMLDMFDAASDRLELDWVVR